MKIHIQRSSDFHSSRRSRILWKRLDFQPLLNHFKFLCCNWINIWSIIFFDWPDTYYHVIFEHLSASSFSFSFCLILLCVIIIRPIHVTFHMKFHLVLLLELSFLSSKSWKCLILCIEALKDWNHLWLKSNVTWPPFDRVIYFGSTKFQIRGYTPCINQLSNIILWKSHKNI